MAQQRWIRVTNWDELQHYKDRDPPWIKLYKKLLDNYEYACLQDASKSHLTGIWLLAARHGNHVPADPHWIAQRIAATEPVDIPALVSAGFIEYCDALANPVQDASNVLALRARSRETETETETETDPPPTPRAREGAEASRLREWLGDSLQSVADRFLEIPGQPAGVLDSIGTLYLPGAMDFTVWSGVPEQDRPRILAIAMERCAGEAKPYHGQFFRKVLTKVIDEHNGNRNGRAAPSQARSETPGRRPSPVGDQTSRRQATYGAD